MVQLLQHSHLHTVFAAATTTIGVGQFPRRRAKFPTSLVLLPRCTSSSSSSSGTSYIASTYLSLPRLIHSYDHFFLRIPSPLLASSSICTFAISHPIGSDWIHTKIPITAGRAPNPTIPPRFQFLPSCKFKGFLSSFPFHCSFIFLSELTPTVVILMDADSIFCLLGAPMDANPPTTAMYPLHRCKTIYLVTTSSYAFPNTTTTAHRSQCTVFP